MSHSTSAPVAVSGVQASLEASSRYTFRVDASTEMGIGHLMRCLTLAERLARRGGEIHFICRDLPDVYRGQIVANGYHFHPLPPAIHPVDNSTGPAHAAWLGASWQEDAEQSAAAIHAFGGTRVLVIDHYAIDSRWQAVLRPQAALICVIDDLADRPHDCDVLFDQNYFADPAGRYRGLLPASCQTLFGPSHALLRPEFVAARHPLRQRNGQIRRLLVFYGGADPDNFTGRTLDALAPHLGPQLELDIAVGAINPHIDRLRACCSGLPHVRLHVQSNRMAELMAAADLAFGACGTASWERCALGLPAIVVIFALNQEAPTHALVEAGAVVSLGTAADVSAADLAAAFLRLADDPELCCSLSAHALALMHSTESPLEDVLTAAQPFGFEDLQLRPATLGDAAKLLAWRNQPEVRQFSRNKGSIDFAAHVRWLAGVIDDPRRHLLIGWREDKPVGVLRLDENGATGEVSIYLCPGAHGKGNGSALLRALEAWTRARRPAVTRLLAEVLDDNDTSHRLFLKNGYTCLPTHYEKRITR